MRAFDSEPSAIKRDKIAGDAADVVIMARIGKGSWFGWIERHGMGMHRTYDWLDIAGHATLNVRSLPGRRAKCRLLGFTES